eukprot:2992959-Pyramimonas_sp.AAC.1
MALLSNIIAKRHHRIIRTIFKSIAAQLLRDAQCEARPHQSTYFVAHTTRGVMEHLREREREEEQP